MPDHSSPLPRLGQLVAAMGTVIGLGILGDSFLYSILPLEAERLGIALPLVGIPLSVNRLVRLGSNTWAAGAATGPLMAYSAGNLIGMNLLYVRASVVLMLAVLQYYRAGRGTGRPGGAYERA